ncbi:putative endoplasmic reticulum protein [Dioszegia hungarica]|uniref:Endoplasmic reticulum protein n=1 Tax=Dioszegia hungarica TaxID=4972 RepID=A0AA38GZJ5_9TREE|nr:putative endoplasmic reticulum protein [Dioszegia hungarica]KAI9631758.1 putative endoplasmic reticulum protein [Dioszegia hungarica]
MPESISVTLLGSTGLTGSATLRSFLSSTSQAFSICTFTRSAPANTPTGHQATTHANRTFPDLFSAVTEQLASKGDVYVSCLGTTRGAAGGFENQKKIDLDLNRDLAKKARADGASVAILVSSGGANSNSYMGYPAMKGQLEDDLIGMNYEHTVILRPGLLMGPRTETRVPELMTQKVFWGLGKIGLPMDSLRIDAADVGDCIAHFATNPPADKVKIVGNNEMIAAAKLWRAAAGQAKAT